MEKFTARNGVEVQREDQGSLTISPQHGFMRLADDEAQALREFFLHERDQELGRWRWPENPDVVVYRTGEDSACAVDERTLDTWKQPRDLVRLRESLEGTSGDLHSALTAYFAAHPEPKPWHDAKHGEAWAVTYQGKEQAVVSSGHYFTWPHGSQQRHDDPDITAGRRIWPEVSDD